MSKLNIKLTKNKQQQNPEVILHFPTSPEYGAALKPGGYTQLDSSGENCISLCQRLSIAGNFLVGGGHCVHSSLLVLGSLLA